MTVHVEAWEGPTPALFVRFAGVGGRCGLQDALELHDQLGRAIAALQRQHLVLVDVTEVGDQLVDAAEVIF